MRTWLRLAPLLLLLFAGPQSAQAAFGLVPDAFGRYYTPVWVSGSPLYRYDIVFLGEAAHDRAGVAVAGDFDFNDFYNQLAQISKLGSMNELMEMMPFFGGAIQAAILPGSVTGCIRLLTKSLSA